jgi:hypothetical protein
MITLSEYLGFIFKEISIARKMADDNALAIAKQYAKDDLLKYFSAPRFKIPSLELKIPVAIAGARFTKIQKINIKAEIFSAFMMSELRKAEQSILLKKQGANSNNPTVVGAIPVVPIRPFKPNIIGIGSPVISKKEIDKISNLIESFFKLLSEEDIIDNLENETKINCSQVFSAYIDEKRLTEDFKTHDANNTIFEAFRINTLKKIQENIVVIENKIENLLVDPETQKIKEQGSDISIFQINTTIVEDGFYVKSVTDDKNNKIQIVEFE